jgi:hypothetical protein
MLRRGALVITDVWEELVHHGNKNRWTKNNASFNKHPTHAASVRRMLVTANVVTSSPILDTPMKEALSSPETSVVTRATRRNIPEHHSSPSETYKFIGFEFISLWIETLVRMHIKRQCCKPRSITVPSTCLCYKEAAGLRLVRQWSIIPLLLHTCENFCAIEAVL